MFTIEVGSEAYGVLLEIVESGGTYKVSFDPRGNGVALKRNEGMWTPTLSTVASPTDDDASYAAMLQNSDGSWSQFAIVSGASMQHMLRNSTARAADALRFVKL